MKKMISVLCLLAILVCTSGVKDADAKDLYTKENHEYLAKIIHHEAGAAWCSDYTRYMVGVVVLKRVKSPYFPDTIKGVLLQDCPRQYMSQYEFDKVKPNKRSRKIARKLLKGGHKALSGYPDTLVYQANFVQGSGVYRVSNGVYFCLK